MLTEKNLQQITSRGLTENDIKKQLKIFAEGIPFTNIVEPAAAGNGIEILSETKQKELAHFFDIKKDSLEVLKFVPASGAATRMFKFLHAFLEAYNPANNLEDFLEKSKNENLKTFFNSVGKFAFSELVYKKLSTNYPDFERFGIEKKQYLFVKQMLEETGLDFSKTPKGLIPFHKYCAGYATAFDEQLYEAAFYANANGVCKLHFTVSENHEPKFKNRFEEIQEDIEKKTGTRFHICYSFQKSKTDTVAATLTNEPFLDKNGDLLFRPSGHGALLENLNEMDADLIFIKNIDNVVVTEYVESVAFQKKVLAGKLLLLQQKIFIFTNKLSAENVSEEMLSEARRFISEELYRPNPPKDREALLKILDRPIRVCGVVENTGAPGGGPFLVKEKNGNLSFQIVEMAQIDTGNSQQRALVEKATHFNPVDLVCGVRNHKGEKYDLRKFADPTSGFISEKSFHGEPIKALELPGLWNGAMAKWNTVFVEVPLITFNPVKTVNDLLNPIHQSR